MGHDKYEEDEKNAILAGFLFLLAFGFFCVVVGFFLGVAIAS